MLDNNVLTALCLFLVSLLFLKWNLNRSESFAAKPTAVEAEYMAETMSANKDKFQKLSDAKEHMPWLDAITFEDSRRLLSDGSFTKQNILKILN